MQQGGCTWVSSTAASSAISLHMRRKAGPISFRGTPLVNKIETGAAWRGRQVQKSIPGLPDCRSRIYQSLAQTQHSCHQVQSSGHVV